MISWFQAFAFQWVNLYRLRLAATKRLADAINRLPENERPSLVSSSAVGYYGWACCAAVEFSLPIACKRAWFQHLMTT